MAQDDRLYPLLPSDEVRQQVGGYTSPWANDANGEKNKAATDAFTEDDYTFTEDGLKDGISIGVAKRHSPIAPKYRGEQGADARNGYGSPWAGYARHVDGANGDNMPGQDKSDGAADVQANPGVEGKPMDYKGIYDAIVAKMGDFEPETKEERTKREKREKRERFLSSIADMGRVMHEAYSYQRGVQPMNIPNVNAKAQERIDRARKEREANEDRWLKYADMAMKIGDQQTNQGYKQMALQLRQQQQDRLDKQEEANRSIAEAKVKYYEAQRDKNDEQAAYWKTKAELLERGWPQDQAEQAARIEERKARAAKYRRDAAAPYGKGGGRGSSSGRTAENDGSMLGRVAVEDPEGYKEAVSVVTGGPYGNVNNGNRSQVAGAYRAQQRRRQSGGKDGGKSYTNTKKLGL